MIDFLFDESTMHIYNEEINQYEETDDEHEILESIIEYLEVNNFKLTDKDLEEKYLKFLFEFCSDYAIYIGKSSKFFKTEKTYFKVDCKYKLMICTKSDYLELVLKNKKRRTK